MDPIDCGVTSRSFHSRYLITLDERPSGEEAIHGHPPRGGAPLGPRVEMPPRASTM